MIIAVDGPAASGKATLSKRLAAQYGLAHLDTGALYRAVALRVVEAGGDPSDPATALKAVDGVVDADLASPALRSAAIGRAAAKVSVHPPVRAALLEAQRAFAARPEGAILDGRDIGTVVCPNADVKLFVTAALSHRVARRAGELEGRGESVNRDALARDIAQRDRSDRLREASPLRPAVDARLLDTTGLSIDAAFAAARRLVDAARDS